MNYISHLESALPNINITEELNFRYPGEGIHCVVKYLSGSNFRDSVVQPVQLSIYTDDMPTALAIFQAFTKSQSNTSFVDGLNYVHQIYSTPMVLSGYQQAGVMFTAQIVVGGQLLISTNVNDITSIKIDGFPYETTSRILTYAAVVDNQRKAGSFINTSNISLATVKFTCSMISKNNTLSTKLRRIRTGALEPDTAFVVVLSYTDGTTESYTMKLDSHNINSDNPTLPLLTMSFTQ